MVRSLSLRLLLATVLVAPLTGACGKDDPPRPGPAAAAAAPAVAKPTPAARPAPAPRKTEPFRDERLGFSVDAARKPTIGEQQVPTAIGVVTAHTYMFSKDSDPGAMIVAVAPSYYEDGDLDLKQSLDDGQQGMLTTMGGTLVESTAFEHDGATGRSFRFTARPQGRRAAGYGKMFLRDGTLYQVLVVHLDGATSYQAECERFVDSFRLLPRPT